MNEPAESKEKLHKWRRAADWWDTLEVPDEVCHAPDAELFDWLARAAPDPYEHDYILYTDGSGCSAGWGGYAAVYERVDLFDEYREVVGGDILMGGSYGSTVQRSEMNAFLDGVHKILTEKCGMLRELAQQDDQLAYEIGTFGLLNQFVGTDRVSIMWYTDRSNLAKSLLFDEQGKPLAHRKSDCDLWLRWSFLARHVCVTPMHTARNVVKNQAICDKLAGKSRTLLKAALANFDTITSKIYTSDKWLQKKPQKAQF
jgi:hypothetical protein